MSDYPLDRLRGICLALPEAIETGDMGNPSFKVREMMVGAGRQTTYGVEH